jgi:predicted kinase
MQPKRMNPCCFYMKPFNNHQSLLLLIAGLPASGKTWLANYLSEKWGAVHINSDTVREALGLRGHYDQVSKQKVYDSMLAQAANALQAGHLVVVDSTFYKVSLRQAWVGMAQKHGASVRFVETKVPEGIAFQRLQKKRPDSEADWQVYQQLKKEWEPLEEPHLLLDSHALSLGEMAEAIESYISL